MAEVNPTMSIIPLSVNGLKSPNRETVRLDKNKIQLYTSTGIHFRFKKVKRMEKMTKEARIYNGEKTVSSISSTGKTGQLHVNE